MQKKKIIIYLILFGLIVASFFIWQKFQKPQAEVLKNIIPSAPLKTYPKIEKFEVPILMYHYIRDASQESELGKNLSVSPANFEAQIKWLKDDNYVSIKLVDLADPERQEISSLIWEKKKPIVLTFDDGHLDAYTQAFPILKKYGFRGTFFIIKDYVGRREDRLNESQIEEMEKGGMEFGSHTLSHPDLTKISIDEAHRQIFDSKGEWQVFCYPAGKYNDEIISLLKQAGYLVSVTTKIGIARENSNWHELSRVRVENVSPQELMDKISYAYEYGE